MILCSYEKCRTIAKYFREGFGLRVFFCDEHKNNQCFGDSALKEIAEIEHLGADEPNPIIIRYRSAFGCRHEKQIVLDEDKRTAECSECGTHLDLFTCLWEIAIDTRDVDYRIEASAELSRKDKERRQRQSDRMISKKAKECGLSIVPT